MNGIKNLTSIRIALLLLGCLVLIVHQFIQPISEQLQFIFFITGIVILGLPHGAADLLIANESALIKKKAFSKFNFFLNYLGRLILFAIVIFFFPLAGISIFILFAAYHFGETDLYMYETNSFAGKLFVISYGIVILGVILLNNFDQVTSLVQSVNSGMDYSGLIIWLDRFRYAVLSFCVVLFFASTFFYLSVGTAGQHDNAQFLIQFACMLFILYHLPLMLGFTFYFIVWHSILSLRNITSYLFKAKRLTMAIIVKQIIFYSLLAMIGIFLLAWTGSMFANNNTLIMYAVLSLAVLTAPHMQIMHHMYKSIRSSSSI